MGFKKMRGIKLPYKRQGQIYFTLLNYDSQPAAVRKRIDGKIRGAAGGEAVYEAALRRLVLHDGETVKGLSLRYGVSESQLYRLRKKLYESW